MVELMTALKRAMRQLEDSLGRQPTLDELSEHMKVSKKKLGIIKKAVKAFNAPSQFSSPDGEVTINDVVADNHNPTPDDEVQHEAELKHLEELLERVDHREATILKLRYGLGGEDPMTLKEIGKRIGLTRERVRQIEHEALKKLRDAMAAV